MMCIDAKATPTNGIDYSCYIKALEFYNQSYGIHIKPVVINSLGGGHTHTYTRTYICIYKGVGRGGSKGSYEPPFNPGFILKIANYLSYS